jgi:hypothetical protein
MNDVINLSDVQMVQGGTWKVVAASAVGFAHQEASIPCQDSFAYEIFGDWVVICVSDGAGSASESQVGAQLVATRIVCTISAIFKDLAVVKADLVRSTISGEIQKLRDELALLGSLRNYDATMVGIIANKSGDGYTFHIGDGFGFAYDSKAIDCYFATPAENGEYCNETYFFTLDDWQKRLRVKEFAGSFDTFIVMTDGCMPFALAKGGAAPYEPFIGPLSRYLSSVDEQLGRTALEQTLQSENLRRITSDDKTIIWARYAPE